MKRIFIDNNGIEIIGDVIYTSPLYYDDNKQPCYDIIIYNQHKLVKLTYNLNSNDGDNYKDIKVLRNYVIIPSLEL